VLALAIGSIIRAVLILTTWPGISMIVLRLLAGVDSISSELGYIAVSGFVQC